MFNLRITIITQLIITKTNDMKKVLLLSMVLLLVGSSVMFQGCAKWKQKIKSDGALIGSTTGDWVVIKQSGGITTDVYKLEDVMVQSETTSDGWLFVDQNDNAVHIGGDMKAIRVDKNKELIFSKYVEYHQEFDTLTYKERYKQYLTKATYKGLDSPTFN